MSDFHDRYADFRSWQLWVGQPPVFHKSKSFTDREQDGAVTTIRAVCGLVLHRWSNENGHSYFTPVTMPRRHAEKFGRPCERCYR